MSPGKVSRCRRSISATVPLHFSTTPSGQASSRPGRSRSGDPRRSSWSRPTGSGHRSASRRPPSFPSSTTSGAFPSASTSSPTPPPARPSWQSVSAELIGSHQPVADVPQRGLDHGAFIPLMCMWPGADVPVLQISMPSLGAGLLLETGRQLAPLRDEGVLIIGSGFLTHGLPFIDMSRPDDHPPAWSAEFDAWAAECVARTGLRRAAGLPAPGSGSGVRPSHRRSPRTAVRRPRHCHRRARSHRHGDRGVLAQPLETFVPVQLTRSPL